jgi:arginase family enzyme
LDLSIFLQPVSTSFKAEDYESFQLGSVTEFNPDFEDNELRETRLAVLGVPEGRGSIENQACSKAPHLIREYLYKLGKPTDHIKLYDFGNIEPGNSIEDTYYAVSGAVSQLIKNGYVVVILGGGQDLTYANYNAYGALEQTVDMVSVDSRFDLGDQNNRLGSDNFLSKIVAQQPNFLFNHTNIGYQTYFMDDHSIHIMEQLYFDCHRLGVVQQDIESVEPMVRNADMLSFDISAIRFSDAPGCANASPHGLYGEEACAISRYAGLSDKLSSIGFYEMNPELDQRGQSAHLVAQLVWHFAQGVCHRKKDYPVADKSEYTKYLVPLADGENEIVFYKSNLSERWWMEVPYPSRGDIKYKRHAMIPCSYSEYLQATQDEMPDRWWKTFQKL